LGNQLKEVGPPQKTLFRPRKSVFCGGPQERNSHWVGSVPTETKSPLKGLKLHCCQAALGFFGRPQARPKRAGSSLPLAIRARLRAVNPPLSGAEKHRHLCSPLLVLAANNRIPLREAGVPACVLPLFAYAQTTSSAFKGLINALVGQLRPKNG